MDWDVRKKGKEKKKKTIHEDERLTKREERVTLECDTRLARKRAFLAWKMEKIKWRNDVSGKWRETIELLDGNPKNVSDFGWTCSPLSLLRPVYPRGE